MSLEKIVADRSLCEGLDHKEWGDTVFVHIRTFSKTFKWNWFVSFRSALIKKGDYEIIPAPTFTEIWGRLPYEIDIKNEGLNKLEFFKNNHNETICGYLKDIQNPICDDLKPENAALKLYNWCKENGYV